METMTLRQRATLVEALSSSLEHGGSALGTIPKALERLLEQRAWREFVTSRGEHVMHTRFIDFVTADPLKGIGSSPGQLYRICPELTEQLDIAFGRKQRSDKIIDNVDIVNDSADLERPAGN